MARAGSARTLVPRRGPSHHPSGRERPPRAAVSQRGGRPIPPEIVETIRKLAKVAGSKAALSSAGGRHRSFIPPFVVVFLCHASEHARKALLSLSQCPVRSEKAIEVGQIRRVAIECVNVGMAVVRSHGGMMRTPWLMSC